MSTLQDFSRFQRVVAKFFAAPHSTTRSRRYDDFSFCLEELVIQRETHFVFHKAQPFLPHRVCYLQTLEPIRRQSWQQRLRARVTSPVWWSLLLCLRLRLCVLLSLLLTAIPRPMRASNAPVSSALPIDSTFSTTEVEKEAADGHPSPNAPDLSRIPAQTDLASKTTLKKGDFHSDFGSSPKDFAKISDFGKSQRVTASFRLSNLDGGPPIKPVRESVAQFLHAESHQMALQRPALRRDRSRTAREMHKNLWSGRLRYRHQRIWPRSS